MDYSDIATFISNIGFPICVSMFLLLKLNKTLQHLTDQIGISIIKLDTLINLVSSLKNLRISEVQQNGTSNS